MSENIENIENLEDKKMTMTMSFETWQRLEKLRITDGATLPTWFDRVLDYYMQNAPLGKEVMTWGQKREDKATIGGPQNA